MENLVLREMIFLEPPSSATEKQKGFENVKFVYIGGMEIPLNLYKFGKPDLKNMGRK